MKKKADKIQPPLLIKDGLQIQCPLTPALPLDLAALIS